MPIYLKQNIEPYGELGIWKVEEEIDFFLSNLTIYPEEQPALSKLKERKLMEWASSRYLLHIMSGREHRGAILKDQYGKPYLVDSPYHISLSHSRDLTAIVASPYLVGIDVQYFVNKITRIAPRFISDEEMHHIPSSKDVLYYHFIWGAKESLFKAYGKGNVDFKKHLEVSNIKIIDQQIMGKGQIKKDDFKGEFRLNGFIFEEYILVYAIQED